MKPPRLNLLVFLLVIIGIIIGTEGVTRLGGLGVWTCGVLTCFYGAHLLSIPHNTGRYWAFVISLGLVILAVFRLASFYGWAGMRPTEGLPLVFGVGVPALLVTLAFSVWLLASHRSVSEFFDALDSSGAGDRPESRKPMAEQATAQNPVKR